MDRHLNLIKSEQASEEKRILPRFPFCFMIFKLSDTNTRTFEVKDISHSGMKIELKNGEHSVNAHDQVKGTLHWSGSDISVGGNIVWHKENELGVEFIKNPKLQEDINKFLSIPNIVKNFKPLHQEQFGLDIPTNLKFWLRADGPLELFIWQHSDGELAKVQFVLMENFVEWEDGQGLKTGKVKSKRSIETPLLNEDEFIFELDLGVNEDKLRFARSIVDHIDEMLLSTEVKNFILRKLPVI
jgi:hypothetical protein